MSEPEHLYVQSDYHKYPPASTYPGDPVLRELQALRKEVRSMFNYCMWVALGFSVVLLFLFLKG